MSIKARLVLIKLFEKNILCVSNDNFNIFEEVTNEMLQNLFYEIKLKFM